jgi:Uma2 family endonuclease
VVRFLVNALAFPHIYRADGTADGVALANFARDIIKLFYTHLKPMTLATAKRFTIEEYHRLIDLEMFAESDRTELIEGEIVKMISKGKPHAVCCWQLNRELLNLVGDRAIIRCQDPIVLPNYSEPESDFAIVRNREDNYLTNHPTPEDILLLIEIADSSLQYDREVKLNLYAQYNIVHYWIFNLLEHQLEVYSHPYQKPQSKNFDYRQKQIFLPDESVALPNLADAILDLAKVFPNPNFSPLGLLLQISQDVTAADRRGETLGLEPYELAFYDALAQNQSAVDVMGVEELKNLAIALTEHIKKNASIDWNLKESVRAKMKVIVKRLLHKYGYPPDMQALAIELVLEQAKVYTAATAATAATI